MKDFRPTSCCKSIVVGSPASSDPRTLTEMIDLYQWSSLIYIKHLLPTFHFTSYVRSYCYPILRARNTMFSDKNTLPLIPGSRCGQNERKTAGTRESPIEQRGQETNYIHSTGNTSLAKLSRATLVRGELFPVKRFVGKETSNICLLE